MDDTISSVSHDDTSDSRDQLKSKNEDRTFADFANGGYTVVPVSVFKKKYITKLDISGNNIRNLPTDIGNLIHLKYLNLSRNGFRCINPDDTSTIPREIKKIRGLECLKISECNLAYIPSGIWEIISLTSLDISGNKINVLPASVGNLDQLKWLNAQQTGLQTIPEEIVGCVNLETLLLYGNQIGTLPYVLAEMEHLKIMSINLRHMADQVDSNMESLLHNGQIKSDHISNTIFNLQRIEKIELEYCKINYVHRFHSRHLTELLLSGNLFRSIPDSLFDLPQLRTLDLAENLLKTIPKDITKLSNLRLFILNRNNLETVPGDIFELKSLEVIDLSHNRLQKLVVPTELENTSLKSLNVSYNRIESLSNSIVKLKSIEDFNLTNNNIKELPIDLCSMRSITRVHQYKGLYKVGLWLLNNPISFPPTYIWNTTDIRQIYSYLEKVKIQKINKKDPIRIVLLGDNNSQKLAFQQRFLNKRLPEDFQFLTIDYWSSPNSIPFVLVNIDSNPIYSSLWRHFILKNSLIWLFIDEENDNHDRQLDRWIGMVTDSALNCVIQIISTQKESEQDNDEEAPSDDDNSDAYRTRTSFYEEISVRVRERYDKSKVHILSEWLLFPELGGLSELESYKDHLEYQAIDKKLFPDDSSFDIFNDKAINIGKLCKSKNSFYVFFDEISEEIKTTFGITDNVLHVCLAILHKHGKVFWFRHNGVSGSKIYPFMSEFLASISAIIKSDYSDDLDLQRNPLLRADGLMDDEKVTEIKSNFLNYGEISLPFYKILTFSLAKSLLLKDFLVDANVAWTVEIPSVPGRKSYSRPYLMLPHLSTAPVDGAYFSREVLVQETAANIDFAVAIKHYSSHDCNEIFTNLLCAINCLAETRFDWSNLCYVIHSGGDIIVQKRSQRNSVLFIDVVSRSWSSNVVDFRQWLDNWLKSAFIIRFNSWFEIVNLERDSAESPLRELLS